MSMQVPLSRKVTAHTTGRAGTKISSLFWIGAWVMASTLPLIPYTTPLWTAALADTPYAYLIWIPVFAFTWAGWALRRAVSYNDDAELNGLAGIPLLALAGSLLVFGMHAWQYVFVGQSAGLLVWPFWALGMAWLMFGVGVTRYVARPLAYLWVTWPPLYSAIVNVTNPLLETMANRVIIGLAHTVSWLRDAGSVGAYNVFYGTHHITVYVTSVCSGADSLLAVVILFPIILVSFLGPFWKKLIAVALAAVLALLANLLRLGLIIGSIRLFGPNFSLGVLHPVLGLILFVLMVAVIMKFAHAIGMESRNFTRGQFLRRPGKFRLGVSVLSFGALTLLLFPLYQTTIGTVGKPLTVKTDVLSKMMPQILGWHRSLLGNYDEASVLGPGAKSTAMTYQTAQGDYALSELWWTYQPISLQGYTESNCLLFHGSQIVSSNVLDVAKGISATVYTVLLPPKTLGGKRDMFMDTVYNFTVKYRGRTAYVRSETAAPVFLGLPPNSSVIGQVPKAIPDLLNLKYPDQQGISPLSATQSIFLHNYLVFIRQFAGAIMAGHGARAHSALGSVAPAAAGTRAHLHEKLVIS